MKNLFTYIIVSLSFLLTNCNETDEVIEEERIEYSSISITENYKFTLQENSSSKYILTTPSIDNILNVDNLDKKIYIGARKKDTNDESIIQEILFDEDENIYKATFNINNSFHLQTVYEFTAYELIGLEYTPIEGSTFKGQVTSTEKGYVITIIFDENAYKSRGKTWAKTAGGTVNYLIDNSLSYNDVKFIYYEDNKAIPVKQSISNDTLSLTMPEYFTTDGDEKCIWIHVYDNETYIDYLSTICIPTIKK